MATTPIFQKPSDGDNRTYQQKETIGRKKLAHRQVSKKPDSKSSAPSVKKSVNIWNKLESLESFKGFFNIPFKGFWKKSGKEEKTGSKEHSGTPVQKASATLKKMAETVGNVFVQLPSKIDKAIGSPFKKRAEAHAKEEKEHWVSEKSQAKVKFLYAEHNHAKAADILLKIAKHDPQLAGRLLQESTIPSSDRDLAINGLVKRISDPKMLAEMVIGAANKEIEDQTDPAKLLKGNTSEKLLEQFIRKFLAPTLCETKQLEDLLKKLPSEVLRTKVSGGHTISKEQQHKTESFIEESLTLITKLLSDHKDDQKVQAFLHICQEIGKKGNEKFGNTPDGYPVGTLTAGNLLLLRVLNTAVLTPLALDIKIPQRTDEEADNAILISKVLQTVANRTQTKKEEEYMSVFNEFIDSRGIPLADGIRTTLTF